MALHLFLTLDLLCHRDQGLVSEISNSDPVSAGFSDWEKKFNIKPADGRQIKGPIEEDELAKKVGGCVYACVYDRLVVCIRACMRACVHTRMSRVYLC